MPSLGVTVNPPPRDYFAPCYGADGEQHAWSIDLNVDGLMPCPRGPGLYDLEHQHLSGDEINCRRCGANYALWLRGLES